MFTKTWQRPPTEQELKGLIDGLQEGRFFHGYYDAYCFLPFYVFCGDQPLFAWLRPSNIDGARGRCPGGWWGGAGGSHIAALAARHLGAPDARLPDPLGSLLMLEKDYSRPPCRARAACVIAVAGGAGRGYS